MDYKEKYKRVKYKVESQERELKRIKEELEGYRELLMANNAIVAAVLYAVGADKDKPIEVGRAVIGASVQGQYVGVSQLKPEDDTCYLLWYEEHQPGEDE